PAFDLAFCLNHLLLKCVAAPQATADLLACYSALAETYLARVDWEAAEAVESRAASLLPALFLARIDGKSPVEYIVDDDQKDRVRRAARTLLMRSPARLEEIRAEWADRL
ncbi:MAG: aminoglycoside phosphotransferase family protein, partial [Rhodomicrobiaceae bacterium]